ARDSSRSRPCRARGPQAARSRSRRAPARATRPQLPASGSSAQAYGRPHRAERRFDPGPEAERGSALANQRLEAVDDLPATGGARSLDERRRAAVRAIGEVDDRLLGAWLDEQLGA